MICSIGSGAEELRWRMIDDDSMFEGIPTMRAFQRARRHPDGNSNFRSNLLSCKDLFRDINIMSAVNCWNIFIIFYRPPE